jgi:RNA polymerase sigma factor (sigma-70 family)
MEVSALTHPSSIPGLRGPSALLRLQSDERLIALTRRGQPAAFEVLCSRYQTRLLSFCRHMLASREDAEDVLQEVFAAAFNAVLADERDINVRPWLYRIARNRSLNHLRKATAIGVDSMDVHFADNGISTGETVMRRESFRELIGDVHQLPETQRTALLLREIDALSYDQIAQAMETTVPSVKSLLVRARISLAEAAEARNLSCEEVRLELGEVAEGLAKLSAPARRHVRGCERCTFFKKQLRDNNRALALVLPVGPLLLFKKLLFVKLGFAKLGSTASAGGAHVAGGAGATMGATASVGAGAAASTGGGVAGGLMTAGAGALATKAVAGLAAAAIVTAGAVAADNSGAIHHRHPHTTTGAVASVARDVSQPVVVRQALQPVSAGGAGAATLAAERLRHRRAAKAVKIAPAPSSTPAPTIATAPAAPTSATAPAKPTDAPPTTQVTEVTTETTELPSAATTGTPPPSAETPTVTTPATPAPTPPAPPSNEAVPVPEVSAPPVGESTSNGSAGVPPAVKPTKPDQGGTEAPPAAVQATP